MIYDVQLICGGKRGEISIDEYVVGSLMIYLDIIRIFLKILQILEKLSSDDKKKKKDKK